MTGSPLATVATTPVDRSALKPGFAGIARGSARTGLWRSRGRIGPPCLSAVLWCVTYSGKTAEADRLLPLYAFWAVCTALHARRVNWMDYCRPTTALNAAVRMMDETVEALATACPDRHFGSVESEVGAK